MTRINVDYNRIPREGAFSLPVRTSLAAQLRAGQIVILDGGEDVPLRQGQVISVEGRRVRLRFVDGARVSV